MQLYIDPGTGSMLFTVLIGVIGAAIYSLRMIFLKLRYRISGGKAQVNTTKIPLVIYSDDKRYWSIFEPICRELSVRGKEVVYLTASEDDPVLTCNYPHIQAECIGKDNRSFARLNYLNATILFSTTPGLDVYQWKRSPDVDYYVHIPHAASDVTRYRMFGIDYYDAILLSGDYQIQSLRDLEKLRGLPAKEMHLVGIPYMDEMAARLEHADPLPSHPRTILLAPTWGPSAILSIYRGKILDVLLKTGYHIIVRPHPQSFSSEKQLMESLMTEYPNSDQLEWNQDLDNFEVLRRSDILISDFSGVVFDFSLIYDKPVIYTDPNVDVSIYDHWWLKRPLWTESALPRIGTLMTPENMENLKELIDQCLDDPQFREGRQQVKEETWQYPGQGAQRTVDWLLNKYDTLSATAKLEV